MKEFGKLVLIWRGMSFPITQRLAPRSEECIKLRAICVDCGKDAWISHRIVKEEGKVVVGGQDKYVALCRTCDIKRNVNRQGNKKR
jgi:thymidine kinase